jgi:sugar lactone lactonase YvrE
MKKIILLIFAASLYSSASIYSQTVSTVTGGTPDDAIALDSNGNIYAANFTGDTVFKITQGGDVTPFITGLNTPNGLAFDSNDNLYVCDFSGQTIFKYDSSGAPLTSFPITGNPSGLIKSFDSDDVIYTNYPQNTINRLAVDGTITVVSSAAGINGPVGLAYDENGVLYVGNYANRDIYRVLANGDVEFVATLPTDGGALPNLGFIAYGRGMLWGTTMGSDKIYSINPNAVQDVTLFAGSTAGSMDGDISQATFRTPNGILFNEAEDTMYITDFGSKNLRIISDWNLGSDNFEFSEDKFQLYPNPSDGILEVSLNLNEASEYNVSIYNLMGQVLYSSEEYSENATISKTLDVEFLDSGVYFVKVSSEGNELSKRFIKR